jgi:hypothetical protein
MIKSASVNILFTNQPFRIEGHGNIETDLLYVFMFPLGE